MSEPEAARIKRRRIRFWHIAVLVLCVLIVGFIVFRMALHTGVRSRTDAIRKAGYPITLSELDEWYTIPPFAENAADYITEAFARLKLPQGEVRDNTPLLGSAQLPPRGQQLDENTAKLIGDLLQDNEVALRLLRESAVIRDCRYPADLTEGYAGSLPHLKHFRDATRLLSLETVWCAEQGDTERATSAILTGLKLADSLSEEPLILSQFVRQACRLSTISTLEFALNRTPFAQEQLIQLDRALAAEYDPNAAARGLIGERCFGHAAFVQPREAGLSTHSGMGPPMAVLVACQRAVGLHDSGWAIYLDLMEEYIRAVQLPPWQRQAAIEAAEAKAEAVHRIHVMVRMLMPSFRRVAQVNTTHLAQIQAARTGVALERYRLDKEDLPEQLTDLVPAYLTDVPRDSFDGKPLRYKKRDRGFIVYSVGPDQEDDGGTERPPKRKGSEESNYDITFIIKR